jgi:hypothetical protein
VGEVDGSEVWQLEDDTRRVAGDVDRTRVGGGILDGERCAPASGRERDEQ